MADTTKRTLDLQLEQGADEVIKAQEDVIRLAVSRYLGREDWTLDDVRGHLRLICDTTVPMWEDLYYDSTMLVTFRPMEHRREGSILHWWRPYILHTLPAQGPVSAVARGLQVASKAPWSRTAGCDQGGVWADLALSPSQRMRFRYIPPGEFLMGSPVEENGRDTDEGPQHTVRLTRGFWLAETPCTQGQWDAVKGGNPSFRKGGDDYPVEYVSWHDACAFCLLLRKRHPEALVGLPTEAQWEYACRAGSTAAFYNGLPCNLPRGLDLALDMIGWFDSNSEGASSPVRQLPANAWGLHDMLGNVWEWCIDARRPYRDCLEVDPCGPTEGWGGARCIRGGAWNSNAGLCRCASRGAESPFCCHHLGFRCCINLLGEA